jgi:hypothetical protein
MLQAEAGRLVLPNFQRDFVWKPSDVSKLLASLLNGYPVGGLLFMEDPGLYGCRPLDGASPDCSEPRPDTRLVLDGQQRLTSCFRALMNGMDVDRYPGRYYIKYDLFLENSSLSNVAVEELIEFYRKKDVVNLISETSKEQARGLFPLDIVLRTLRGTDYSKWLSGFTYNKSCGDTSEYERLSQLQSDFIRTFIEKITSYQVHYEEIKKDTPSDVICTVFETINTTGKRLTVFDLLVARCFPNGMNLRDMLEGSLDRQWIRSFDPSGEGLASTALPRIIALREKGSARRADLLELDPSAIQKNWMYAVDALDRALELMATRYGCCGEKFIPLLDMVAPLAMILSDHRFNHTSDFDRLDKWYWRCVFSQYYVSSTETKIQRTVRQWLGEEGWLMRPDSPPDSVKEFVYRPSILEEVSRIDNAIYRGVFSLILSRGARDWGRERKVIADAPWDDIEDHHIYPKRFLAPYGIKGEAANNIVNRTPLLRRTNSAVNNDAPHVYLCNHSVIGADSLDRVLSEHFLDEKLALSPFTDNAYTAFKRDRASRIINAIAEVVGADPISRLDG